MDILVGSIFTGGYMNSRTSPPHDKINTGTLERAPIYGNNLYDNAVYNTNKSYLENAAYEREKLARKPEVTGVIPVLYNQLKAVEGRTKPKVKPVPAVEECVVEPENNTMIEGFGGKKYDKLLVLLLLFFGVFIVKIFYWAIV